MTLTHAFGHAARNRARSAIFWPFFNAQSKNFEHFGGVLRLVLLLVHQDEARAGDRPARLARLVGQDLVEARRVLPVGERRGRLERVVVGLHELRRPCSAPAPCAILLRLA